MTHKDLIKVSYRGATDRTYVGSINRGYEDFANRLNTLGAEIETLREI